MLRSFLILSLICYLPVSGAAKKRRPALATRVERVIAESPVLARAHVGIRVVDLKGKTVFQRNERSWFVPASNTKLYSTSLALMRLGPEYRMTTRITAEAAPDGDGVIRGDVRLVGGGDPSLSGRTYPYDKDKGWADAVPGMEALADAIERLGVRRIEGAVIGDDTAYLWEPFPEGWGIDDPLYEYGAPVSALTFQDNSLRLEVRPGETAGEAADVYLSADVGQVTLLPLVTTIPPGERGRIRVEWPANTNELRVFGTIEAGAKPFTALLAVADPALYAAQVLAETLQRRGISVRDPARGRHRLGGEAVGPDWTFVLAERRSRPLRELVQVVNKVSQNLHAELLLREVSRQGRPYGSRETGLDELKTFLETAVGIREEDVNFEDGSGLSRLTLLTPEATAKLLLFMARSGVRDAWLASLPVGGEDGTLSRRFNGTAEKARIRAKTGTLSHVGALAGYLDHRRLGPLAFTVLVNNYNALPSEARRALDKLIVTLLE